ncbi:MAG: FIVAR domain-containing protein, partial [Oscillospiraceae bacterium]|nr:FIVAR domain-containing protein [Oscillospiraceae bacterium]
IKQDEDRYGNKLGLTFGPATGADYTSTYKAHLTQDEYDPDNEKYCLHWMTWEEIIAQSEEDPTVFQECFENGCTHAVNLKLNSTLLATSYESAMDSGDGAGVLLDSVNPSYRSFSTSNANPGGWPGSLLRATLNGKDRYTSSNLTTALDASDSLFSCFPSELRDAIVPAAVTSDTKISSNKDSREPQTIYDRLWLPSGKEVYGDDGTNNGVIHENEGTLSQRSEHFGITTENYGKLVNYDENGTANIWKLRSLSTSGSYTYFSYQVIADGNFELAGFTNTTGGIAPCFCLQGTEHEISEDYYDVKYAVSIWGINHDIDEDGNILGLTFGPATGKSYIDGYVAHIDEDAFDPDNGSYCIHWMTWDEIAAQAAEDPTVFEECMEKGCTHSVNLALNETLMEVSYSTYMDDGDGVSALYESIKSDYRKWNDSNNTTGGWPASQIRAVLNGKDELTGDYAPNALDASDSLLSCFPETLRNLIVAKAVPSSTVVDSEEKDDIALTNDKLWLFSPIEGWDYCGTTTRDQYLNPSEGALYERSIALGISTEYDDALYQMVCYDEEGAAQPWFLRSIYSSTQVENAANSRAYLTYSYAQATTLACSPGFCLGKTEAKAGDKSDLQAEYDADLELDQYDYTEESWAVLVEALEEAKALLDKGAVTQDVIDTALKKLQAAKEDLEITVNKTKLQAEYDEDIRLKEIHYTAESWKPFGEALETAKELLDEENLNIATQEKVDAALVALQEAKAGLVRVFETSTVNYAVKIWGIGHDKYSFDGGNLTYTTGLTFGPATGDNAGGDGTGYLNTYKAHLTEAEYEADEDAYCIHWMDWDEIIAQSETDPSVFEDCLKN